MSFSPVSSANKADRHDIAEILLKVALNTIKPNQTKLSTRDKYRMYIHRRKISNIVCTSYFASRMRSIRVYWVFAFTEYLHLFPSKCKIKDTLQCIHLSAGRAKHCRVNNFHIFWITTKYKFVDHKLHVKILYCDVTMLYTVEVGVMMF